MCLDFNSVVLIILNFSVIIILDPDRLTILNALRDGLNLEQVLGGELVFIALEFNPRNNLLFPYFKTKNNVHQLDPV